MFVKGHSKDGPLTGPGGGESLQTASLMTVDALQHLKIKDRRGAVRSSPDFYKKVPFHGATSCLNAAGGFILKARAGTVRVPCS